jgi:hypothetical protein
MHPELTLRIASIPEMPNAGTVQEMGNIKNPKQSAQFYISPFRCQIAPSLLGTFSESMLLHNLRMH